MDTSQRSSASELGEFELIAKLHDIVRSVPRSSDISVGIGDDCAAVRRGDRTDVYTTDTLVDGVHFRSGEIPWPDLGWKSIAVNLSDIAAMGTEPLHTLVTIGLPSALEVDAVTEIYEGMAEITTELGGPVIGGDVIRSPVLFISVAAVGTTKGELMLRTRARPSDKIAVTGTVGDSRGGLRVLEKRLRGSAADRLKSAHFRPAPRTHAGPILASGGVRAAIDVSDGLLADLAKLCEASGVRAEIDSEAIPVSESLRELFPVAWLQMAVSSGEDYELLVTASPEVVDGLRGSLDCSLTVIGEILSAGEDELGSVRVLGRSGEDVTPVSGGWDHLRA